MQIRREALALEAIEPAQRIAAGVDQRGSPSRRERSEQQEARGGIGRALRRPREVVAFFGTAIEREPGEDVDAIGSERHRAQTVNEEPQPQVVFAFGLRITNCAPLSDSA